MTRQYVHRARRALSPGLFDYIFIKHINCLPGCRCWHSSCFEITGYLRPPANRTQNERLETTAMPVYSAFAVPTLGMLGQSAAMNNIGVNIANLTTGGYKRTETAFSTLVSKSLFEQSDLGGIKAKNVQRIDQQGALQASPNDLDLAINGRGMFIFETAFTGGDTVYGRDGTFALRTVNDISVTGNGGATVNTKDGYLVDKNGYFLQGYTAVPATGLFTSNTLSSLRIDQFAFSDIGLATSTAALQLNIPSTDIPGASQVDQIVLSGTVEAGDTYSVTVSGTTVSYVTTGAEASLSVIRNALVAAINADATVGGLVTASNSLSSDALIMTGQSIGTTLTTSASAINGGGTADNASLLTVAKIANAGTTHTYNIEIIDSNFNSRSVAINFRKNSTNTWALSSTVSNTLVNQVDTVTIGGTVEAGDVYSITTNGQTISYTVIGTEANIDAVRDALVTAFNASSTASAVATAAAGATGKITITADTAGSSLVTSVNGNNAAVAVAQVDTLTIGGTIEAGDTYDIVVDGNTVTYTTTGGEGTLAGLRSAIRAAINADGVVGPLVTAADGGAASDITLTAAAAGTAFTATITATNLGATADNTGTIAATTANATSTADNTATVATTTANVTPTLTTNITTLTFDANGALTSPSSGLVTLAVTLPADANYPTGTASVTLDISEISQFAGDFLPISYSKNGFAKANLTNITFDASGQVI
ncbi:MAG TPA: flagellar hook-basal body complex protein, partial [Rhodospirillales bacterium]|nr:flagellar hook-basal body complex protein [Rhodospirillales bacterium]